MAASFNSVELVRVDDPLGFTERGAIAGFLAGYTGNTLVSYTTGLRLFAEWCTNNDLRLLDVRRAHLEIFGRTMETDGRMRSTAARDSPHSAASTGTATSKASSNGTLPRMSDDPRSMSNHAPWD